MFDFKNKTKSMPIDAMAGKQTEPGGKIDKIKNDLEKDKKETLGSSQTSFDTGDVKVRVMPDKFLAGGRKKIESHQVTRPGAKKVTGLKKNLLIGIIIGVLVVAMLSLGGWFLIKSIETPEEQDLLIDQKETEPDDLLDEEELELEELCSFDNCRLCSPEECLELSSYCYLEDLCIIRNYQNEEFCPDYICVVGATEVGEDEEVGELTMSRDSDFDMLTDVEEGLWGTNPMMSDTDADGYNDGIEIENLYNPLIAGSGTGKLSESDLIKIFTNSSYGYLVYYPASWQVDDLYTDQIRFTSNTSEFIQVIIQENYMGYLTAKEWYLTQNPNAVADELEEVLIGNWSGIKSPDKLNIYLVNNNYIYTLTMNIGLKTELNYQTTFEMMLKSFQLFESPLD